MQGGILWREGKLKMEGHLYIIIYCKLIIQAILNKNIEFTQTFLHPQECRTGRQRWITEFPVTLGTILQDIFHKFGAYAKILHGESVYLSLPFFRWSNFSLDKWNNKAIIIQ